MFLKFSIKLVHKHKLLMNISQTLEFDWSCTPVNCDSIAWTDRGQ